MSFTTARPLRYPLHKGGMGPAEPLPLPMGEVAERSEDGEGKQGPQALSVTCGDSSPSGRAKPKKAGRSAMDRPAQAVKKLKDVF